jgi:hypothetical protein
VVGVSSLLTRQNENRIIKQTPFILSLSKDAREVKFTQFLGA